MECLDQGFTGTLRSRGWLAPSVSVRRCSLPTRSRGGQLISQTGWRDPAARAASPSVAEMIRSEVLADHDGHISAVEDYCLVFGSERKPGGLAVG